MKFIKNGLLIMALVGIAPLAAQAQTTAATAEAPLTAGVVKKIDKEQGKITIKHGPLVNLGMPGMTMIFHVADPAMLSAVAEGDQIEFTADKINGALTVIRLQTADK